MTFLNDDSLNFLQYLFIKKTIQVNTKNKTVCEVGPQKLKLQSVNMRPMKMTQCMFILEFLKDKKEDEVYVPIMMEYVVSLKDGEPDIALRKLCNMFFMAYNYTIDLSKGLTDVYGQLLSCKGKYVNTVVRHKSFNVYAKGKLVYDDSISTIRIFGKNEPMTTRQAYIFKIRHIDKPFQSYEINYHTLIDPPTDQK